MKWYQISTLFFYAASNVKAGSSVSEFDIFFFADLVDACAN